MCRYQIFMLRLIDCRAVISQSSSRLIGRYVLARPKFWLVDVFAVLISSGGKQELLMGVFSEHSCFAGNSLSSEQPPCFRDEKRRAMSLQFEHIILSVHTLAASDCPRRPATAQDRVQNLAAPQSAIYIVLYLIDIIFVSNRR